MNVTKAIIPVAGWGTRRLPITKSIEKCMLPLLNRPLIDYVVQDVIAAGITDIYFVVSNGAGQLRSYYERNTQLERYLEHNDKTAFLPLITPPRNVRFHYVEQDQEDPRYGTTVPVWLCRDYVTADEHFLVIMGDQHMYHHDGPIEAQRLIEFLQSSGADGAAVGVPIPREQVPQYGVFELTEAGDYVRIVEHPSVEDAPSNLNNGSFYLLPGTVMPYLDADMNRPHVGEYQIIDPINAFVADGKRLAVRQSDALYCDCGSVEGWVAANVKLLELTKQ